MFGTFTEDQLRDQVSQVIDELSGEPEVSANSVALRWLAKVDPEDQSPDLVRAGTVSFITSLATELLERRFGSHDEDTVRVMRDGELVHIKTDELAPEERGQALERLLGEREAFEEYFRRRRHH